MRRTLRNTLLTGAVLALVASTALGADPRAPYKSYTRRALYDRTADDVHVVNVGPSRIPKTETGLWFFDHDRDNVANGEMELRDFDGDTRPDMAHTVWYRADHREHVWDDGVDLKDDLIMKVWADDQGREEYMQYYVDKNDFADFSLHFDYSKGVEGTDVIGMVEVAVEQEFIDSDGKRKVPVTEILPFTQYQLDQLLQFPRAYEDWVNNVLKDPFAPGAMGLRVGPR